jgi:xylan 1,4-beta-xylosidase
LEIDMQLMCDALSVLGSRHGLVINPIARECEIVRFDRWDALCKLHVRAGAVIEGREVVFSLCPEGETFRFLDQRLTPCTMALIGMDAKSGTKVKLTMATPFRPRDAAFSTTPVIGFRLEAERIAGSFRWEGNGSRPDKVELFLALGGKQVIAAPSDPDAVDLCFNSVRSSTEEGGTRAQPMSEIWAQRDRLVAVSGQRQGTSIRQTVQLDSPVPLEAAWCTHSDPNLSVQGDMCPFKYAEQFADLAAVADWARANPGALFTNAARVDGIVASGNGAKSVDNLLAQTLHSWLIDTWWAVRPDGRDWFSVWEGSCYFHSTVDVEFTQSPFYLAVWPELLRIELDFWPEYSKDGTKCLGPRGQDTLFLSHDTGSHSSACGQDYHHEMEVEETTNYLILSWTYQRRTGDDSTIFKHAETIRRYLQFLFACDTTGNGIPDKGVANTIDDASPAVQFGTDQIYLAVKTLAALEAGREFMLMVDNDEMAEACADSARRIRELIAVKGWAGDHFVTLLEKEGRGIVDPWSGEKMDLDEVPGWDAPHIYTANGLAPLDMVGIDLGLDKEKLRTDLRVATERCLREYGCVHTDFASEREKLSESMQGLAGVARNPGWVSMNMLRDISAFYRGVDLRALSDRYWAWQTTTNSQEPKIFFETFCGNNLCFYPRGIACWGYFDALGGLVIDRVLGRDETAPAFPQTRVPRLIDADWKAGTWEMIESC